jgi:hypothetical protein
LAKATEQVAKAARRTGKHWGRPTQSPSEAQEFLAMGATFLAYNSDLKLLRHSLQQTQHQFAAVGFAFDNQLIDGDAAGIPAAAPNFGGSNGPPVQKILSQ